MAQTRWQWLRFVGRESITADLHARAARFEAQYGRAPSQRELAQLAQASNFKTRHAKHGTLDAAQVHAGWADKLARTLGVSLASVAPSVWHGGGHAGTRTPGPDAPSPLPHPEMARAAQKAVALAQQDKSTWTRADVIRYLGRVLPRSGMDPAAVAALLEDLADRALRSEFEPVLCLEAPEPVQVPASLLRADGRRVYQRHGGVRYATGAQLALEERMVAHAGASGAPRMGRAQAAQALGADPAALDATLTGRVEHADAPRTRSGLRADQAAAGLPRRARRWPCWPACWTATGSSARPPRPQPGPGRRRPPGPAARDLDRPDHPSPRPAVRDLLLSILPPGDRREPGHQARWLWRTLRAAELAGLDPAQLLADAVGERDLAGARDVGAVIDARLRARLGALVPHPAGPWSAQVPAIADPERHAYLTQIAALMDARKDRIGEHAADHAPPWAITALGPVPAHPLDRLDWQKRAAAIGAWRELSGYHHPADPIGAEPVAAAPDLRAAWHEAFAAVGLLDGPDVRGIPDGLLWHLRDTYPIETAWAPQWVGDELRQVRAAAWDARLAGLRASAESRRRAAARRPPASRPPAAAGRQLPGPARGLPAAGPCSPSPWPTGPTGTRPPCSSGPSRGRRRRTPPPPPRRALPAAVIGRTRARHQRPARRTHDDGGRAGPRSRAVDQGPGRGAPNLRRPARRPAEPGDPLPGSRLRRPRPGVPALAATRPRRDLAAPKPEIRPCPQILQHAADRHADFEAAD